VILDLQMPVMDGFEAAYAIRHMDDLLRRHIPIFALSAYSRLEDQQKAYTAGVNDFIGKPVREQDLALAIARHFNSAPHLHNIDLGQKHLTSLRDILTAPHFKAVYDQFLIDCDDVFATLEEAIAHQDGALIGHERGRLLTLMTMIGIKAMHEPSEDHHRDIKTQCENARALLSEARHIVFELTRFMDADEAQKA
jgi:CheY-like chemotaxis protein